MFNEIEQLKNEPQKIDSEIQLIGGGLVGSMLAIFLARKGYKIDLFERRSDMRKNQMAAGRSINLAISTRGLTALDKLGLKEKVLEFCIPMSGRAVHSVEGDVQIQPYGLEHECIYSVSRGDLNKILLTEAEKHSDVTIHFNTKLSDLDFATKTMKITENASDKTYLFKCLIGTDGTASAVREAITAKTKSNYTYDQLSHSYKELIIPKGSGLTMNALHIWPRKEFLLIALANLDGSFTATLFLAEQGEISFANLKTEDQVNTFFKKYFNDVYNFLPNLTSEFFDNPTGHMVTVKTDHWVYQDQALIMGDAAHGIVPFFGQGMNCGFEDCAALDQMIDADHTKNNWQNIFSKFFCERKINTDAIADLAKENFIEMRDKVSDEKFLAKKAIERQLMIAFPQDYISRYQLVSFSNIPYRKALEVGLIEDEILNDLSQNLDHQNKVDILQAKKLIESKLKPHLKDYINGFTNSK